jgi:hypothetical protein
VPFRLRNACVVTVSALCVCVLCLVGVRWVSCVCLGSCVCALWMSCGCLVDVLRCLVDVWWVSCVYYECLAGVLRVSCVLGSCECLVGLRMSCGVL